MEQQYNPAILKELLLEIRKEDRYEEILSKIFELNINGTKPLNITDLISNLSESFSLNCTELIGYFFISTYFTCEDLKIDDVEIVRFINILKKKYGYIIRKTMIERRDPLTISNVETSFTNGMSHASILFERNDNEKLSGVCTAQNLLGIIIPLNNTVLAMIRDGVYNLDLNTAKDTLNSVKQLNDSLESILSRVKG